MTCKDCLGFDFCKIKDPILKGYCTMFYDEYSADNNVEINCHKYKDKSKFIELPCKVGDKVYFIEQCNQVYELIESNIFAIDIHKQVTYFDTIEKHTILYSDEYNKTWFTDKSKAEAKLKELNENG